MRHRRDLNIHLSKMNRWRRYLYLLVDDLNGTYPLRRINASNLFFARNQVNRVNEALTIEETPLPRPHLSFTPSQDRGRLEFFGFFGHGRKKSYLAAVDFDGVSYMYDVERRTMHEIASPNEYKCCDPVSLAVGDALYVMDREPVPSNQRSFEALIVDLPNDVLFKPNSTWHCLQPLPFVLETGYKGRFIIGAYTVAGGSNILISTPGIGTYSFDTSSCSWRKAGDWELPFRDRADFFPEHGVWLGFSSQDNLLCSSSDITAPAQGAPTLDMVWEDLNPPCCWDPLKSHLVYLGSNKFCVAKFFERVVNVENNQVCIPVIERFVVFTGLVLKPTTDHKGLVMLKQRSHIYRFEGVTTCWVF
ncbi:hypothetical protein SEVIR_5G441800v4 [Setaria viridis]|uniref:F-box associated domain-containing protein n=2 Tax=Setaria TaxID=4554 RepID=A0A368RFL4_SETIT|nr:uncharacterized protein LOC101786222 [Setaria italica]XP_034597095.1 uncharacterized protein LOC117858183 [Setaria viridis]RCV28848.1 hypothetical protein SETIT_5G435800v2 [Setaria italica]TKW18602.1 hypothetical protein SEVIR_5G441800v2 [Setaria viridis]